MASVAGLVGEELARWDADEGFARWVSEGAGLRFALDVEQEWRGMAVKWWLADDDFYVLVICSGWPHEPDPVDKIPAPKGLTLADVYAIGEAGRVWKLGRGELPRFKRRALVEAGYVPKPAPYQLLPLPEKAPDGARITWACIESLLGTRRMTEPVGTPVGLNEDFLQKWDGGVYPSARYRSGKGWLEKHGYIIRAGLRRSRRPKPLVLWAVVEPAVTDLAESA